MRSRHFHFSKAATVDTKTIYQQRGGRARRGLQDFSVTELRAARWVIPGNEREEEEEEGSNGSDGGGVSKPLRRLSRKPRSATGTQTWILYSCLCTETLRDSLLLDEHRDAAEAVRSASRRHGERKRKCLTEEDVADQSDRPWEEEAGASAGDKLTSD